jgi:Transposase DDE domain group 1
MRAHCCWKRAIGLIDRLAAGFSDAGEARAIEHTTRTLVGQRVFSIALGYEDLVDNDELRHDPVMIVLAGKMRARRKGCAALAGKSTLSCLEHAPQEGWRSPPRYDKISHDAAAIERLPVAPNTTNAAARPTLFPFAFVSKRNLQFSQSRRLV